LTFIFIFNKGFAKTVLVQNLTAKDAMVSQRAQSLCVVILASAFSAPPLRSLLFALSRADQIFFPINKRFLDFYTTFVQTF